MRFRGITDEGEVIEFKNFCSDSDNIIEYGSEIGVYQGIWHYVKKDTLVCLEVEDLERQLAEDREEKVNLIKWLDQQKQDWGSSIKDTWNPYCRVLSKLKEKGDDR